MGGDFYDYFLISEDRIAVVVGDVSGKGVPAALFMTLARNAFRMVARSESSPARVLAAVNRMLCEGNNDLLFLTSVYGTVDRWTGEFTYGIGGHDAPLLMRGADGAIELEPTGDMVLGIEEGLEFSQKSVTLAPDDLLLVYTDGVTEAQSETDTLFGRQRLRDLLAQARQGSAAALIEEVNRAVDSFISTVAQADDITCLALRLIQAPTRRTVWGVPSHARPAIGWRPGRTTAHGGSTAGLLGPTLNCRLRPWGNSPWRWRSWSAIR